ncbi:hypothetical protein ERICV_05111 [Paenibacillus phage phiERICV]|uniref:DUF7167 domain-containing protein n=1 Tax=Paenibacillus larvae subsp. larvae TaxID=147375 RepID=A0A6C0QN76_9BACL|nr:hypothetical protein [Paenibacillus larvae]QHZ50010.1 hypothetical protein ERICV_00833 [Paenibacillus larvae subsp. larvae]QHZ54095.1 hypothetical protein ERICV_05111 [Paenibacillus phage phiERICV]
MKIRYTLSIGYPTAVRREAIEIDEKELEGLEEEEIQDKLYEIVYEYAQEFIDLYWERIDE